MELEVVTVGTELLLGFTLDSNAADLGRALAEVGIGISRGTTVGDDAPAIAEAVRLALRRSGLVLVTGGLGPTTDDVTKAAVAEVFDVPLELDEGLLRSLEQRWASLRSGPMPERNRSQAMVPRGATTLPNPRGTAPGLWLEGPIGTAVLMPGVPHEMRGLLRDEVVPRLLGRTGDASAVPRVTRSRTVRTTGIAESGLAGLVAPVEASLAPAALAYLPGLDGVDLRLTVRGLPADEADAVLDRGVATLGNTVGLHAYGEDEADLAAVVIELLRQHDRRVAVAESCTGGLMGARLTAVPGASAVFVGGVLAYADGVKVRELGVAADLLQSAGAVSREVAVAMVEGVTRRFGVDAGLAATGIAGPAGGTPEKPVGTVWLAAQVGPRVEVLCRRYPGTRRDVRHRAAQAALDLLRRALLAGRG